MKTTCLATHTWLDSEYHYQRLIRWVKYNAELFPHMHMAFIDNASSIQNMLRFQDEVIKINQNVSYLYQRPNLKREGLFGYGYSWRMFYAMQSLFLHFDRVIYSESDFFICSDKMRRWALLTDGGLATVFSHRFKFPESAFFVLLKTCDKYREYIAEKSWQARIGELMETSLPWTEIEHSFIGDRVTDQQTGAKFNHPLNGVDFVSNLEPTDQMPEWIHD